MHMLERVLGWFSKALLVLGGVAIVLMMLHIGADIVGKYVFNAPIVATLEIVTWYYMVATVFLPVAYIQLHKKHLMVELFTRSMAPAPLARLEGLISILGFVYVGILFLLTLEHAIDQTMTGEVQDATFFDLPIWPSRWLLPFAFGTMALLMLVQAVQDLVFGFTGRGAPTQRSVATMDLEEA